MHSDHAAQVECKPIPAAPLVGFFSKASKAGPWSYACVHKAEDFKKDVDAVLTKWTATQEPVKATNEHVITQKLIESGKQIKKDRWTELREKAKERMAEEAKSGTPKLGLGTLNTKKKPEKPVTGDA